MLPDAQLITFAAAFCAAIVAVLYNNSRITDLRSDMNGRFADVGKRFDDMNRHIDDKFEMMMERMQRMEDNITHQLANHEARIQKLEQRQ